MNQPQLRRDDSLTTRTVWVMAMKTLGFAFSFVLPLLLVRRLNQTEFGLYKQAFLIVATSMAVIPLGFSMSAFYFLPREHERRGAVVLNILVFYFAIGGAAGLGLALFPSVLMALFNSPALLALAPLIGAVILLWVVTSVLETIALADQDTRLASTFIVCAQFTKTLLLVAAAVAFASVRALLYAAVIQGVVQVLVLLLYLRSRFPGFWRRPDWDMMRAQMSYVLPLGIAGVLFALQNDMHNYFVAHQFGAAAFAIYSIGCFQLPLVGLLSESVGSIMIPRASALQKQGELREIVELTARVTQKLAAVYFPLYVFLLVVGREFLAFLFTPAYLASWPVFVVNLTLLPVSIVVFDPVMRAFAAQRFFLLRVKVGVFIAVFITLWFGIARLGLVGVIAIVVAANIAERGLAIWMMCRVLLCTRHDLVLLRDVGRTAVAAVLAGAVTWGARMLLLGGSPLVILAGAGLTFLVCYVGLMIALGVITTTALRAVYRALERPGQSLPSRNVQSVLVRK